MRYICVHARAFGPFIDHKLDLAPGMNIISGLNGAGKSSWHAALYAALCGARRGPGLRKEDANFTKQYRPWRVHEWDVTAEVALDNGRRIEIHHDLDGNVDCRAYDLDLGRDISAEIINDGSPDGARFVGLDRRAFLKTACIRQGDILGVLENPEDLQEQLQRAAATAGKDATAAAAIEAIDEYLRECIGRDQRNSTKPLHLARVRCDDAQAKLREAETAHAQYLARLAACQESRTIARDADHESTLAEAIFVRSQADELKSQAQRASALTNALATEPQSSDNDDEALANEAAAALGAYANLTTTQVGGEDPEALRAELAGLPESPELETAPDSDIVTAHEHFVRAQATALENLKAEPKGRTSVASAAQAAWSSRWVYGLGMLTAVADIALFASHQFLVAGGITVLLALVVVEAVVSSRRRETPETETPTEEVLHESDLVIWQRRRDELNAEMEHWRQLLAEKLRSRRYEIPEDLHQAYRQYIDDCAGRGETAKLAARRADLEKRLEAATQLRELREQRELFRSQVENGLREVARKCDIDASDAAAAASRLELWQRSRRERLAHAEDVVAERKELATLLLNYGSLAELERVANEKDAEAVSLASPCTQDELEAWKNTHGVPTSSVLRRLRETASQRKSAADSEQGELDALKRSQPNVADRTEELAESQREFARLEELGKTLETAREYLRAAQEAVHRSIAPILATSLEKWLPTITNGVYSKATVDPEALIVSVKADDGDWREAMLLSHGTREQIYVLLRIAMAEHLTKASDEKCPLLLDEVTAHCDPVRTAAILNLLHDMSRERQVIVFSQEQEVVEWGRRSLGEADKLQSLDRNLLAL
jgi:DNA repair protein SbcC/Rad50